MPLNDSQIVIKADKETLRYFKAECIRRGTTPGIQLNLLMEQQLKTWLDEPIQLHTIHTVSPGE